MQIEPQKEHAWLQQIVGEWTYDGACNAGPDQPPMKSEGTTSVRSLGGLWIVAEGQGEMPGGGPATTIITLGYDPAKGYTGTFVGSMMTHLWLYNGEMDGANRVLTLNCEGPSFSGDGSMANYQDVVEIVSPDHWILRARVQGEDGAWTEFMETHYRRKG